MVRSNIRLAFKRDRERDRTEFEKHIDSEQFEREYGRRPLTYDPDGNNSELLQELNRQYKRRSSSRAVRGWSPLERPTPVLDLLPPADQSYLVDRLVERKLREKQRAKGRKSPRYRRAVESGIDRVLRDKGVDTAAKEVWKLLFTPEYCSSFCEDKEYRFERDRRPDNLLVLLPNPNVEPKLVRYKTFEGYVTKVKKELRRKLYLESPEYEAWFYANYDEISARALKGLQAYLKKEPE